MGANPINQTSPDEPTTEVMSANLLNLMDANPLYHVYHLISLQSKQLMLVN